MYQSTVRTTMTWQCFTDFWKTSRIKKYLHKLKAIWSCANEIPSRREIPTSVFKHHVSLLICLKWVMVNKLTAANVKAHIWIIVFGRQEILKCIKKKKYKENLWQKLHKQAWITSSNKIHYSHNSLKSFHIHFFTSSTRTSWKGKSRKKPTATLKTCVITMKKK